MTLIVPLNISQSAVPQSTGEARAAKPLYHVARTSSGNLPVYSDSKRGGNLHQTIIRKISGDAGVLRDEIRDLLQRMASAGKKTPALSKIKKDVVLNSVNNHVIVKVRLILCHCQLAKYAGLIVLRLSLTRSFYV